MSDQVLAALITGLAGIVATVIGLWWRERTQGRALRPLASGSAPPIFDAARQFARFATPAQQQTAIQPIEVALSHGTIMLTNRQMELAAGSDWELDRIGLYLFEEYTAQPNAAARLLHVRHEFERLRLATGPRSPLPLFYALRSLLALLRRQPTLLEPQGEDVEMLHTLRHFAAKHPQLDPDQELRRLVERLLALVEQRRRRSA